jgi:hypothetical protein
MVTEIEIEIERESFAVVASALENRKFNYIKEQRRKRQKK